MRELVALASFGRDFLQEAVLHDDLRDERLQQRLFDRRWESPKPETAELRSSQSCGARSEAAVNTPTADTRISQRGASFLSSQGERLNDLTGVGSCSEWFQFRREPSRFCFFGFFNYFCFPSVVNWRLPFAPPGVRFVAACCC